MWIKNRVVVAMVALFLLALGGVGGYMLANRDSISESITATSVPPTLSETEIETQKDTMNDYFIEYMQENHCEPTEIPFWTSVIHQQGFLMQLYNSSCGAGFDIKITCAMGNFLDQPTICIEGHDSQFFIEQYFD
jgi:hypothetical protein